MTSLTIKEFNVRFWLYKLASISMVMLPKIVGDISLNK